MNNQISSEFRTSIAPIAYKQRWSQLSGPASTSSRLEFALLLLSLVVGIAGCSKGSTVESAGVDISSQDGKAAVIDPAAKADVPSTAKIEPDVGKAAAKANSGPPKTIVLEDVRTVLLPDRKTVFSRGGYRKYSDDTVVDHGLFTQFYENGQKFEEGYYTEGKKVGPWHNWYKNGKEARTVNYVDGQLDGKWTRFNEDGLPSQDVSYKAGKRDGIWTWYYTDGKQTEHQEEYKEGKKNGTFIYWFSDGKKANEMHFVNDEPDGIQRQWFANGQMAKQVNYSKGKVEGRVTLWNEKGSKVLEEEYAGGKKVEPATSGGK